MALYHYSVKIIGRNTGRSPQGRSVVAAAAYRAGVRLYDPRSGLTWDYRPKGPSVAHREILAPTGAPSWVQDRQLLWASVEAAETRCDAQLAREIEGAIPVEIPRQDWAGYVRQHLQIFADMGMVVDWSIHDVHGNPHFHALALLRRAEADGLSKTKDRTWNNRRLVETWREHWERTLQQALTICGSRAKVSRLSLAEQGITRPPQVHLGPIATQMERRGIETDRGAANKPRPPRPPRHRIGALVATLVAYTQASAITESRLEPHRRRR